MIKELIALYRKFRLVLLYVITGLICLCPIADLVFGVREFRFILLSMCPIIALFVLHDAWTRLEGKLGDIERTLHDPNPPSYASFEQMQPDLRAAINDYVLIGKPLRIDVIAVSAKFSWPFFNNILTDFMRHSRENGTPDPRIELNLCIAAESTLSNWNLVPWLRDLKHACVCIKDFRKVNESRLSDSGIKVNVFHFDNLPQLHGVLIDGQKLFLGRCEWESNSDEAWTLRVGEVEYRRFELTDSFGGARQINGFSNWARRYMARDQEIKAVFSTADLASTAPAFGKAV